MDPIREAFQRIKDDMDGLRQEIVELRTQFSQLLEKTEPTIPTQNLTPAPTPTDIPVHIPTLPQEIGGFSDPNLGFSTRNRGVPTDKPTDRQTNQQTDKSLENGGYQDFSDFHRLQEILDSLDSTKKEIRLKFKRLTPQEMLVFTTLYNLEEQGIDERTYKLLSNNLNLSESSIRDYTNKLIKKGIPIKKTRQNNKQITLTISKDLKNLASLPTIIKLREL